MIRSLSLVLGVGLAVLWIFGVTYDATAWLTWLDLVAALCAFLIAIGVGAAATGRSVSAGGALALGLGLGALWIIAVATAAIPWLTWWTFAFACAFILLGLLGSLADKHMTRTPPRAA